MQLVKAHTTLANKGIVRTPHLLKAAIDPVENKRENYIQEEDENSLKFLTNLTGIIAVWGCIL